MKKNEKTAPGAWEVLGLIGGAIPGVSAISRGVARSSVQRLLGFWVMWHLYGGLQGILSHGVMAQSTAYRQVTEFRAVFGQEVEDWSPALAAAIRSAAAGGGSSEQG